MYKFYLDGKETIEVVNWNDVNFKLAQSSQYFGYFRMATIDNAEFFGETAKALKFKNDTEFNPYSLLEIYKKDTLGNYFLDQSAKIDFSTFSESLENSGLIVTVKLIDNNEQSKIKDREGMELVIGRNESVGGSVIPSIPLVDWIARRKTLRFDSVFSFKKELQDIEIKPEVIPICEDAFGNSRYWNQDDYMEDIVHLGLTSNSNNIPFAKLETTSNYNKPDAFGTLIGDYKPLESAMLLLENEQDREINLAVDIDMSVSFHHCHAWYNGAPVQSLIDRSYSFLMEFVEFKKLDNEDHYSYVQVLSSQSMSVIAHEFSEDTAEAGPCNLGTFVKPNSFVYNLPSMNFTKKKGYAYAFRTQLVYLGSMTGSVIALTILSDSNDSTIKMFYDETLEEKTIKGMPIYECFQSLLEQQIDKTDVFHSETFGRTDLGYSSNGEFSDIMITSGMIARDGKDPDGNSSNLVLSFEKLYQKIDSIVGLKMFFQSGKMHIEKRDWGRDAVVPLRYKSIKASVWKERMFNNLIVGNDKVDYENVNGTNEFNSKLNFSLPKETQKKELILVGDYNTDYLALELAMRSSFSSEDNTDSKYDEKILIIDVEKISSVWNTKTVVDKYDIIQGLIFPDTAFNLRFSPKRCLLRNQDLINAVMHKSNGQRVRFEKADNLAPLVSRLIGGDTITEQADFTPLTAVFEPKLYELEGYEEEVSEVFSNPNNLYQFEYFGQIIQAYLYDITETEGKTLVKLIPKTI